MTPASPFPAGVPGVGDRVLVTTLEVAGVVEVDFGDGSYYVRADDGDVIACGLPAVISEASENQRLAALSRDEGSE
jgi:hypothetical protein